MYLINSIELDSIYKILGVIIGLGSISSPLIMLMVGNQIYKFKIESQTKMDNLKTHMDTKFVSKEHLELKLEVLDSKIETAIGIREREKH